MTDQFKQTHVTLVDMESNQERTVACEVNRHGIVRFPNIDDTARIASEKNSLLAEFRHTDLPVFFIGQGPDGTVQLSLPVSVAKLCTLPGDLGEVCANELDALKTFVEAPVAIRRLRH